MNLMNRFVTVLIIVLVWFVIVLVAATPDSAQLWAQQGLDWAGQNLDVLANRQPSVVYPLLRAAVILGVTALAVVLLWAELRHKPVPVVKVRAASGGQAAVTASSVERRLAWHLDQLADVVSAHPSIKPRGKNVDVEVLLETSPDVDVPMKTDEVIAVTHDVIEEQMGLQVRKVSVQIEYTEYEEMLVG